MIIISPYSKPLRNGNRNPKNYPYWLELISLIERYCYDKYQNRIPIVQIGSANENQIAGTSHFAKETPFKILKEKIKTAKLLISVDNFLPHFASYYNKDVVVLWGQSDPELFGYKLNINLLKDRKHLRHNQFDIWEGVEYKEDVFLSAEEVFTQLKHLL